jgi:hypothetical protein
LDVAGGELSDEELVAGMIAAANARVPATAVPRDRARGWLAARLHGRDVVEPDGNGVAPGVLVSRETWQRVLDRASRLEEAKRELAEARAQAARAEIESRFLRERAVRAEAECKALRERLATLRTKMADAREGRGGPAESTATRGSTKEVGEEPAAARALREWLQRRPRD